MPEIDRMAEQLISLTGVTGVMLGGSRARGSHRPDSDWDLGLYYRGELDLDALRELAAQATGTQVEIAGPGGWGPWVNGGAWLSTPDGAAVDWILRDLDRVRAVCEDCSAGRYENGSQPGHPLGFFSPVYPGEVALGRVLADPSGELTELKEQLQTYPAALRETLYAGTLWEAGFCLDIAAKGAKSGDTLYVSLCVSRAIGLLAQALHAHHGSWCLNEKGALAATSALPRTPEGFAERATSALQQLSLPDARSLVTEVAGLRGAREDLPA